MASKGTLELRLDDHPERSETGFRNWLDLIKDKADEEDWGWFLPDRRLSFRHLDASPPRLRTEFSAGAKASSAIVQINEPTTAGSENPLSGIAVDHQGIRYVVRQGTLHKNRVSPRIDVDEFQRLTRLRPVVMKVGDAPSKRHWFVVAQVDRVDAATVVAQTADFVDRCWTSRLSHAEDKGYEEGINDIFGGEERGGTSTVVPTPDPREVHRIQGYVWEQLHARLKAVGIVMRKPRHAEGYEVDAEILAPGGPILLEIKTSTSPADVYTGIGQLEIYPELIARLQGHRRVLLLPGDLKPSFARAVEGLNVELHAYRLADMDAKPIATFSEKFLFLCGVTLAGGG